MWWRIERRLERFPLRSTQLELTLLRQGLVSTFERGSQHKVRHRPSQPFRCRRDALFRLRGQAQIEFFGAGSAGHGREIGSLPDNVKTNDLLRPALRLLINVIIPSLAHGNHQHLDPLPVNTIHNAGLTRAQPAISGQSAAERLPGLVRLAARQPFVDRFLDGPRLRAPETTIIC